MGGVDGLIRYDEMMDVIIQILFLLIIKIFVSIVNTKKIYNFWINFWLQNVICNYFVLNFEKCEIV